MGELLSFPSRRGDGTEAGAERRSAPAGPARPSSTDPKIEAALDEVARRFGPAAHAAAQSAADEPGWAVPGVDTVPVEASEPVEPPTRSGRRASNVALAALTRHDASESELRATLVKRGLEEEDVAAELERLRSVGLVDDAALATRLVAALRSRKGLGDGALRPALRARGIPPAVVDAVLAEHPEDDEVVEERLQEVADARARRLGGLPREVAERRLTAFLMRKGYGGSAVRGAARSALERAGIR